MSTPEQEALEARRKHTIWLLAGAAACLILPLIGVVYIRLSESRNVRGPNPSVMFDRREAGEIKIKVAPIGAPGAKVPVPVKVDSSLSYIKGNGDYPQDKTAKAPKASPPPAATAAPAPSLPKNAKKPFIMPKLQGVKTLNTFKGGAPKQTGGQ